MIRRRLVLAVTLTMVVAIGLGSFLVVRLLESRLIGEVDEQFTDGSLNLDLGGPFASRFENRWDRLDDAIERRREVAVVLYSADGTEAGAVPSGTEAEPDPLPEGADLPVDGGVTTVASSDGGPRYRAISVEPATIRVRAPEGSHAVIGISLAEVDETLAAARRIQLVMGLGAVTAVAVVSWLLIRRAFAPIDGMISTAGRIAEGDLDQRTVVEDPTDEVGRLGTALNAMLDRIQTAVDEKTASEERMRRFVADASHDLRTPLTSVRGYAELYRQGASDPDAVALGMERIEAEATRMSRLVDDLMVLARLDQQRPPQLRPVDVGRLVGEAVDAVRVVDGERTYDLDVAGDGSFEVSADPDQLRQVLDNLLRNASLHTPSGTEVEVTVDAVTGAHGARWVRVVVADDGPGLPESDRKRAFDRFWRSTRADENPVEGSGLGLSIVRSIVEGHGGTVTLDTSDRDGARFTLHLPAGESVRTARAGRTNTENRSSTEEQPHE